MSVWVRRLAWVAATVLGLWLLGWLALPPLLKWQGEKRLTDVLGRQVTIGEVRFLPWKLDLTVSDLSVAGTPLAASAPAGAASAAPLLQVGRIHVNASTSSIVRLAPVLEAVDIDALRAQVTRTSAGHYDIDDLIARFMPDKPAAPAAGEPAHFALYNVQLHDAELRFDDRPAGRVHKLDDLRLDLPFVSNLPAEIEVKVQPRLAFRLNGARFDSGAQATPFAATRRSDLKLSVADLDLVPYIPYLPAALPVRLASGKVAADLALRFMIEPRGAASLAVQGTFGMRDVATTDASGAPLLGWQRLQLELRDVQPLARRLAFGALRIDGAELHAARDAAGRIDLLALVGPQTAQAPAAPASAVAAAAPASGASAAAAGATGATGAAAWQVSFDAIALQGAKVVWNDSAVHPAAALQLDGIALDASGVKWPVSAPMPVALSATLRSQAAGDVSLGTLKLDGKLTERDAVLHLALADVALEGYAPYAAQALVPKVAGKLAADGTIEWSAGDAPRLKLALASARLDGLRIDDGAGGGRKPDPALAVPQVALADATADLMAHEFTLGRLEVKQPALRVRRDAKGELNLQHWLAAAPAAAPAASAADRAWRVRLKEINVTGGSVKLADAATTRPVRLQVGKLDIALRDLALEGARTTAPAQLQVSARAGSGGRDAPDGAIAWKGRFGLQPLVAEGTLRIDRLPIHAVEPYFAQALPVSLRHADAGYAGRVAVHEGAHGYDLDAAGDALLADVRIETLAGAAGQGGGDELLSWQTLALKQLKVALKPPALPQIDIGEVNLDDFYSRLVVTEQGRFNLQDVGAPSAPASAAAASNAASGVVAASELVPAADAASAPPSRLPVRLTVGATHLSNGRVDFSDHYVRPNYSAQLTELAGQLGAFRSDLDQMATLELHGKAAGTAIVSIAGSLNPSTNPPAMDIRAKATDLELAPLSPYAGKYAGYVIDRGKLSMDVAYKIAPDGTLTASNQVVVNQLTFGDKIDSPDATRLPVLLAVALLKDRNGVIDLNLPLSGSLKDPQFSVGALILKVIGNLLAKALTAPFALLSGGGSDDLSLVEFEPGTSKIAPAGQSAIDKVAQALADRPALRMTVTGAVDPTSEREAFQRAALEASLVSEKKRQAARASEGASAPTGAAVVVSAEERERLLKAVYKDTDLPDKPRNFIGMAKSLPPAEMEAMLAAHMPVNLDLMRELALQRGVAVREALVAKGITSDRLFLAAPQLREPGSNGAAWTPRVQLTLSMK